MALGAGLAGLDMEPALESCNEKLVSLVTSVRENFWLEHGGEGLTDAEIQQLWAQQFLARLAPALGMSPTASGNGIQTTSSSQGAPTPALAPSMQSHAMERSRTDQPRLQSQSMSRPAYTNPRKRALSTVTGPFLNPHDAPRRFLRDGTGAMEGGPFGAKMRRTTSGNPALASVSEIEAKIWEPGEWVKDQNLSRGSGFRNRFPSNPINAPPLAMNIPLSQSPGLSSPLSSSLTASIPPTPQSAGMDNAIYFPTSMGRQDSITTGLSMIRFDSQMSNTSDYARPYARQVVENADSPTAKTLRFEPYPQPGPLAPSAFATSAPVKSGLEVYPSGPIAKPRDGVHHSTMENGLSIPKPPVSPQRRTPPSTERPLMPKLREGETCGPAQLGYPLVRIKSENGVTEKYKIPAMPTKRQPKEKMAKCTLCNAQPEGFRGEHELRRHQLLMHTQTREAWMCIDISEDGKKLEGCKNCRDGKKYGAYYNAAAHLRRVHFHPKGDRKASGSPSRGGKGGGNDPPMSVCKLWMKKVVVTTAELDASELQEQDPPLLSEDPLPTIDAPDLALDGPELPTSLIVTDLTEASDPFTATPYGSVTDAFPWPLEAGWDAHMVPSFGLEESEIFHFEPSLEDS